MMRLTGVIFLGLVSSFSSSFAETRAWQLTQVVGDHQDSTSTVIVYDNGNISFDFRFSNGHKTDGDHFVAEVVLYNASNEPIIAGHQGAGVNASLGGQTQVATVSKSLAVTPQMAAMVDHVKARHYQKDTKGEIGFFISYTDGEWSLKPIFDAIKNSTPPLFANMGQTAPPGPPRVNRRPACPEANTRTRDGSYRQDHCN